MDHEITIKDDCAFVSLSGEIDLACSNQVRIILLDMVTQTPLTVLDLSAVELIDSSGVANLLDAVQTAKRRGHKFELANPSPKVIRVLELAQLNSFFTIRDN